MSTDESRAVVNRYFQEAHFEVEETIAVDDKVVVRTLTEFTHVKGEFRGIEASGKRVSYRSIGIYTIMDGHISEVWSLDDGITMLRQMGMHIPTIQGWQLDRPTAVEAVGVVVPNLVPNHRYTRYHGVSSSMNRYQTTLA